MLSVFIIHSTFYFILKHCTLKSTRKRVKDNPPPTAVPSDRLSISRTVVPLTLWRSYAHSLRRILASATQGHLLFNKSVLKIIDPEILAVKRRSENTLDNHSFVIKNRCLLTNQLTNVDNNIYITYYKSTYTAMNLSMFPFF